MSNALISAGITVTLFLILHFLITPGINRKELRGKRLMEVYAPIFYLSLKYRKKMRAELTYESVEIDDEFKFNIGPHPEIEGFDEIEKKVEEILSEKIHLLFNQDAKQYIRYVKARDYFENRSLDKEITGDEFFNLLVTYHQEFINFIDEVYKSYIKLYHVYFRLNYVKEYNEKIKKEIERMKEHPFYSDERKDVEKELLYQKRDKAIETYHKRKV